MYARRDVFSSIGQASVQVRSALRRRLYRPRMMDRQRVAICTVPHIGQLRRNRLANAMGDSRMQRTRGPTSNVPRCFCRRSCSACARWPTVALGVLVTRDCWCLGWRSVIPGVMFLVWFTPRLWLLVRACAYVFTPVLLFLLHLLVMRDVSCVRHGDSTEKLPSYACQLKDRVGQIDDCRATDAHSLAMCS